MTVTYINHCPYRKVAFMHAEERPVWRLPARCAERSCLPLFFYFFCIKAKEQKKKSEQEKENKSKMGTERPHLKPTFAAAVIY
jgi:hypothetical protein